MRPISVRIARIYGPFADGVHVHGVSFDGIQIWMALGDRLQALDRDSGALGRSIAVSATAGTAFDGKHLYQIGDGVVRRVDPASGQVVSSFPVPGEGSVSGMAWSEGFLWIGRERDRRIDKVDPETGEILRSVTVDHLVTGVTWHEGDLWHGSWDTDHGTLHRVAPDSGATLERLDLPKNGEVTGLETDGKGNLICGGGKSGNVRVVRKPGDREPTPDE